MNALGKFMASFAALVAITAPALEAPAATEKSSRTKMICNLQLIDSTNAIRIGFIAQKTFFTDDAKVRIAPTDGASSDPLLSRFSALLINDKQRFAVQLSQGKLALARKAVPHKQTEFKITSPIEKSALGETQNYDQVQLDCGTAL